MSTRKSSKLKQTNNFLPSSQVSARSWWVIVLLVFVTLACLPNSAVSQRSTPRPTRTQLPTFTPTPIPPTLTPRPSATATFTETPTATPTIAVTDTPLPTDTPTPTNTSLPTNTPLPQPTAPPPPTDTPVPVVAPEPVSPLATPTNTPVAGSPPGKYRAVETESNANCAHVGVTGWVSDKADDDDGDRIANVTIEITGDEDGFRGPYYAVTDNEGEFGVVIGEFGKVPERVEFLAQVFGPDIKNEDRPRWQFNDDCHGDDALQILNVKWAKVD